MQAVGVTTVPARTSAPLRKSRLLHRRRGPTEEGSSEHGGGGGGGSVSSNQAAEQQHDLQGVNRRGICEDILAGGHVQTFVDFFYLTHRPQPVQGET